MQFDSHTLKAQISLTKKASYALPQVPHETKKAVLLAIAKEIITQSEFIITQNQRDLATLSIEDPKRDRLLLTPQRIQDIAQALEKITLLDAPIGKITEAYTLPNGLFLQKKTVPLGVIAMIYEARPNVTLEAFALCFMSSNACILKGGSEAKYSNGILVDIIHAVLTRFHITSEIILLLPPTREVVDILFTATGYIDVIIPRGSQSLIDYVKQHSQIPVIETGAGVVHTYFDVSGDKEKAKVIITNAKTRRVSVCNALDCLILHQARLADLPYMVSDLLLQNVIIYADEPSFRVLQNHYPAALLKKSQPSDYGKEFLAPILAVKTVANDDTAMAHIQQYSSQHSEAIIAEDTATVEKFLDQVDAAVVYANTSTAFTDGEQFGMGSEIGVSTQKLHVRGPFSMQHLVSTKWLVQGNGQIRK